MERPEIRKTFKWWIAAVLVAILALFVIHCGLGGYNVPR